MTSAHDPDLWQETQSLTKFNLNSVRVAWAEGDRACDTRLDRDVAIKVLP